MSNYNYSVKVNPSTPQEAQVLVKAIVNDLKVEAQWEKNTGTICFQFDAEVFNAGSAEDGDPTLVANIKKSFAELLAGIAEAEKAGLSVVWVATDHQGRNQIIPQEIALRMSRTY